MREEYEELENDLSSRFGVGKGNVVCCSSGTAALHLALEAFQISNLGTRQVLIPDYTMYACSRAVILADMVPVTVDCNRRDLLMNVDELEGSITNKTCAIMAVHIYGRICDRDKIADICETNKLLFIEDMAEAHGVQPHCASDAACWSFYRNKIIAGEEGGAVYFKDKAVAAHARKLRSLGFNEPHDYSHVPRGHNYRLSNTHARLIRQSNWAFDRNLVLRREIEKWYDWECPEEWRMPDRESPWVYDFRIRGMGRETQGKLIHELREEGIQARHGFKPISTQEEYKNHCAVGVEALIVSNEVIYLPIQPGTTDRDYCKSAFGILKKWYRA